MTGLFRERMEERKERRAGPVERVPASLLESAVLRFFLGGASCKRQQYLGPQRLPAQGAGADAQAQRAGAGACAGRLSEGGREAILRAVSLKSPGGFKSLGSENLSQGFPMDCGQSPRRSGRHEGSCFFLRRVHP